MAEPVKLDLEITQPREDKLLTEEHVRQALNEDFVKKVKDAFASGGGSIVINGTKKKGQ